MKGLIGRKLGMTQVFGPEGEAIPVTVLEVAGNTILQVKTADRDGYEAIQVGYGQKKLHRATKANRTRAEAAGLDSAPLRIREFRTPDASLFKVGDEIAVDFFKAGDRVKVRGITKGRGFAGAIKRHGFSGGTRKTHGGGPSHRGVGSTGMSADPAHTPKGRKLPGQYGNRRSTVSNLLVVHVDVEDELLLVRGSVPGAVNGLVRIELVSDTMRTYATTAAIEPEESADEATEPAEDGAVSAEAAAGELSEPAEAAVEPADDAVQEDVEESEKSEEESEDSAEGKSE